MVKKLFEVPTKVAVACFQLKGNASKSNNPFHLRANNITVVKAVSIDIFAFLRKI